MVQAAKNRYDKTETCIPPKEGKSVSRRSKLDITLYHKLKKQVIAQINVMLLN